MEAYTYKCPSCGAELEYDVKYGLFHCNSCGQYYKLDDNIKDKDAEYNSIFPSSDNGTNDEYMDVRVYHCSSCGSEIMTNDVEVSTFCSYCGQSTIMFDKISKEKRPKKIVPFKITKEDALNRAKYKFGGGKYSFNNINEVTIEAVRAIYMPYYVYDSEMSISAKIDVKDEHERVRTYEKNKTERLNVALDASKRFNDNVSVLLNPFMMSQAEDFDMSYLSGFYADRSDVDKEARDNAAESYLMSEIEADILDETPGVPNRSMREKYTSGIYNYRRYVDYHLVSSKYECISKEYTLLPVYFITFKAGDETVIILVNGQTGKIVGNVPINEKKFKLIQLKFTIIGTLIGGLVGAFMFRGMPIWWAIGFLLILTYSISTRGSSDKSKFFWYYEQTNSVSMFSLSNDREKK